MLIFIGVAKFNYTIFVPACFYLVIHQIKLNQPTYDLAWFKNVCANIVTQVSDSFHMRKQLWVLTHYCPRAVCSVDLLEIATPFAMLRPSQFTCCWIGANSPRLMGRSVKHQVLHKLCCSLRNANRTRFSEPQIVMCIFHVHSSPELEKESGISG